MLRVFQKDIFEPGRFVVTLELVPGRQSSGRDVDKVIGIARDAFSDGRVSAVSITDNPGGNPALSPDVLGFEIFKIGMDVIVHFTCRDMNRVGMESRALQLAMMGMKNILALTGDYSGSGFGGQGAPIFDIDSVQLQILLFLLNVRMEAAGDPDHFLSGCAVSPFKATAAESYAQYAKLCRKAAAGAQFIITQLGYDAGKFSELIKIIRYIGLDLPVLASLYLMTPKAAHIIHSGRVPGAFISDELLGLVTQEWRDPSQGMESAIDRAAKLAAVLKGIGYKGIHIGGIHKDFSPVAKILDRMEAYESQWRSFVQEFQFPQPEGFYAFRPHDASPQFDRIGEAISWLEKVHFRILKSSHGLLFDSNNAVAPVLRTMCAHLQGNIGARLLSDLIEDPVKRLLLDCQMCGDCGIQDVAFLCPESQCPKHMRNGACGGSLNGRCEVYTDRSCVWVRAYGRLKYGGKTDQLSKGCVPPRMWELNRSSSWINFHLGRDHHGASNEIVRKCRAKTCSI